VIVRGKMRDNLRGMIMGKKSENPTLCPIKKMLLEAWKLRRAVKAVAYFFHAPPFRH
jgi:hypothetical protein